MRSIGLLKTVFRTMPPRDSLIAPSTSPDGLESIKEVGFIVTVLKMNKKFLIDSLLTMWTGQTVLK